MTYKKLSFLIFMALCIAGFCTLGTWQIKRLHWKENLIVQIDAAYQADPKTSPVSPEEITTLAPDHFIRGSFTGSYNFDQAFYLMGQIDNGKQTSHLMLPFNVSKDATILIDLGPDFLKPQKISGNVTITGLLKHPSQPNKFTPDNVPGENIWYSVNTDQLDIKNLKPFVILPEETPWKNFDAHKPELRNAHLQYAVFWFTLALVITGMTAFYLRRSKL